MSQEFPDQSQFETRSLGEVRDEIDAIDVQIASLLEQRLGLVSEVRHIKDKHGLAIVDVTREIQVLDNVRKLTSSEHPVRIFRTIIDECRIEQGALTPREIRDYQSNPTKGPVWRSNRGW